MMMNKLLRFLTVLTVCTGLAMLGWYVLLDGSANAVQSLSRPSYYTKQGYLRLYMTGSGCVILSLLSAFLAWNKRLDPVREFLPNAAGADAAERSGWVAGSTLDTTSYAPSGNPKNHTYIGTFASKQETHRASVSRRNTSKPPRKESTLSGKTMGSVTRLDQKANRSASAPRREIDWEKDWDKLVARYDLAPSPGERKKSTDTAQTGGQTMYARDAARTSKAEDSTVIRKYERKPRE